jgi:predicted ArsR family transcriptional regulator
VGVGGRGGFQADPSRLPPPRPAHADKAAAQQAHRRGYDLGTRLHHDDGAEVLAALTRLGFEPEHTTGRGLRHNFPFHALADSHTSLVCGLNNAFLTGLLDGLHATNAWARLAPHPGRRCVEMTETDARDRPPPGSSPAAARLPI